MISPLDEKMRLVAVALLWAGVASADTKQVPEL